MQKRPVGFRQMIEINMAEITEQMFMQVAQNMFYALIERAEDSPCDSVDRVLYAAKAAALSDLFENCGMPRPPLKSQLAQKWSD